MIILDNQWGNNILDAQVRPCDYFRMGANDLPTNRSQPESLVGPPAPQRRGLPPVMRFIGFAFLFNLLLWLLALFVQIRGWVDVTASYIILAAMWGIGSVICLAFAMQSGLRKKWLAATGASLVWLLALAGLNAVAPRPHKGFIVIGPAAIMNGDSWDFVVTLKGGEKAESVDILFTDENALAHVRKITPPNVAVNLNDFSRMIHIDEMYSNGLGSIFAKQFLWKPFDLEHERYTADISASIGRFHENLFLEKVNAGWKYAARLDDIDTHRTEFICRDPGFPPSVAPEIIASAKCLPGIVSW
jgi:hypothetical protein